MLISAQRVISVVREGLHIGQPEAIEVLARHALHTTKQGREGDISRRTTHASCTAFETDYLSHPTRLFSGSVYSGRGIAVAFRSTRRTGQHLPQLVDRAC